LKSENFFVEDIQPRLVLSISLFKKSHW